MADEAEGGPGPGDVRGWTYRLLSPERIHADPENSDFRRRAQDVGPNANAGVEVIVGDFTDEAQVVSIARHTLHVGSMGWTAPPRASQP